MKIIDRKFLDTPTPSAHASSIVFYKGRMYSAWFGGTREGTPDVCIYLSNGEKTKTIGENFRIPCWNPVWCVHEDDLYLFYKVGEFCDRWQTFIVRLDEDLNMLGKPQLLPAGLNGPVKTAPIVDGNKVYCGSSVETFIDWACYIEIYNIIDHEFKYKFRSAPLTVPKQTYDAGFGRMRATSGILQPALWQRSDSDAIYMLMRSSRGLSQLYYADLIQQPQAMHEKLILSSSVPVENIQNPNSSVDVVYHNGRLFIVCNPDSQERSPLVIYSSNYHTIQTKGVAKDEFQTVVNFNIKDELVIGTYEDVEDGLITNELSYPYMIENDGKLYLSYTYRRSKIEVCTIEI